MIIWIMVFREACLIDTSNRTVRVLCACTGPAARTSESSRGTSEIVRKPRRKTCAADERVNGFMENDME